MNRSTHKQHLREDLLKRRNSISEELYHRKSKKICQQLTALPEFKKAQTVHCYVSINERNEVNTHPLIKTMLAGAKQVVVPITKIEEGTLRNVQLTSFDDLELNRWGVLEPTEGKKVRADKFDIVIVPMVGGDQHKNRIGYGKGFYDRFLAQTDCPKIGLLFEQCLVDELPAEKFDVPLDKLITEKTVIS